MPHHVAEKYIPKKPCKRCGTRLRYVSGRTCVECGRGHAKRYWLQHPDRFEVYRVKRCETKRLKRARAAQQRKMGLPLTPMPMPPSTKPRRRANLFMVTGHPAKFKRGRAITGIMQASEVMDTAQATAKLGIVGTMHAGESPDTMTVGGVNMDLRSHYLFRLLLRDSVIWKRRQYSQSVLSEDDGPILGSGEADTVQPRRPKSDGPKGGRYVETDHACQKCGTHLRYESTGSCVECLKRRNKAIKEAKRKAKEAATVVELRPGFRVTQVKTVKVEPSDKAKGCNADTIGAAFPRWSRR